jgi:hypothetical protein
VEALDELADAQLGEAARGIDEDQAFGGDAAEEVDLVQQRRVLDDQRVGRHHRLAQADLAVGDAAEGHHRRPHPFRAEAGEGLRMLAFEEGGDGEHFRGGNDALPAASVDANLEHVAPCIL